MRLQRRKRSAASCVCAIGLALSFLALLTAVGTGGANAATDLPLTAAIETHADSWAVLPMGQLAVW